MDIRNLKERHQELIDHMIAVGYSSDYIQHIRHEIRNILENPDNWDSYEDLIESYMQKYDLDKAQHLRSRIRLIARFDLEGILPRDPDHPKDWNYRDSAYQHLNDEFMGLIDYYIEHADFKVKKETTYQNEASNAASFLLTLQNRGVKTLAEIDENYIVDILTDENGVPSKSGSYTGRILAVFKGSLEYSAECGRIVHILPSIRKRRKNIQYLKPYEKEKIQGVLHNEENHLCLRDKAIGCLLYYTGLRCSDVANLRFSDIDWEKEELSIVQQKTEVPLTLPLTTRVGNSIYEYITSERIDSDVEYIFLSQHYPFGKMTAKAVGRCTSGIFREANIRQHPGDRRGAHIFRHNFATTMLENGISRAMISHALGHASPVSTDVYLSADMVHLKELGLSIEEFPVRKGVFSSERV